MILDANCAIIRISRQNAAASDISVFLSDKGVAIMETKKHFTGKRFRAGIAMLAVTALFLTACSPSAANVHHVSDLEGRSIGVQSGTTGDTLAGDIKDATVQEYTKAADGIRALRQKKIDAVIVDLETANALALQEDNLHILDEELADEEYAIAIQLGNTQLRSKINEALRKLSDNGTLQQIKQNYEGDEQGQHPYHSPNHVDRSNGVLVMATNAEFPPYEYYENGKYVGFDIDMMNAVCDYLGYELRIDNMDFDDVLTAVETGKADVGVAGLSVTPEREEHVLFSDTYATTHQVIIVRK